MTDYDKSDHGPAALRRALEAADALISRMQEQVADRLARTDGLDEKEGFYELVATLETAPEIAAVRMALGQDPSRFGAPTPYASGGSTG